MHHQLAWRQCAGGAEEVLTNAIKPVGRGRSGSSGPGEHGLARSGTIHASYADVAPESKCVTKRNGSKLATSILERVDRVAVPPHTHGLERTELNYLREPSQLPPISLGHRGTHPATQLARSDFEPSFSSRAGPRPQPPLRQTRSPGLVDLNS